MQTIYADVFFFINMFVDFLLLLCVKRIIHSPVSYTRLLLGALTGAILSFTAFLPFNHFPINIFFNVFTLALSSIISFGYKNKQRFIKNTVILVIITFLYSGALIAFYNVFKPNGIVIINNAVYFNISPLLLIVLTLIIYIILFAFKKLFKNNSCSNLIHNVKIYYSNKEYNIKCKVDSGCNVKEPFSNDNVIIVDKSEFEANNMSNMRIIPYNSLGGKGILKGYKAEKVFIDDKPINEEIYFGLSDNIFSGNIKGLVPVELIKE